MRMKRQDESRRHESDQLALRCELFFFVGVAVAFRPCEPTGPATACGLRATCATDCAHHFSARTRLQKTSRIV